MRPRWISWFTQKHHITEATWVARKGFHVDFKCSFIYGQTCCFSSHMNVLLVFITVHCSQSCCIKTFHYQWSLIEWGGHWSISWFTVVSTHNSCLPKLLGNYGNKAGGPTIVSHVVKGIKDIFYTARMSVWQKRTGEMKWYTAKDRYNIAKHLSNFMGS